MALKLCGKFIANLKVLKKENKGRTVPRSPLAGIPQKHLSLLVTPRYKRKGEQTSLGMLVGK